MAMEQQGGWARRWFAARLDDARELRQGAWYPVLGRDERRVVLDVSGRQTAVTADAVELRAKRPDGFTVVYRSRHDPTPAQAGGADLGRRYAVCPMCAGRKWLGGQPEATRCHKCGHEGAVAWWETG
ncbi:MAG TPA: hypothetical protein VEU55_05925 [Gemmatimonadales bacterium]|nr:hypothetical protein [Gemmatimonadales bacterium]